jgi:hypothetical protein
LIFLKIYLATFFGDAFLAADLGFEAFLAAAGFFVAVDLGFFGVVAFLTFGFAAFFVAVVVVVVVVFFAAVDFVAPVFFALLVFGLVAFFVDADFGLALVFGLAVLAIVTFFDLGAAAAAVVDVVAAGVVAAELLVLAAVATFFAGFVPADFERARFFVPDADVDDEVFFVFVDFFLVGLALSFNLNEPLAPLPLVCLNDFDFTPFLRANFKC